jgi:hypothetical protein
LSVFDVWLAHQWHGLMMMSTEIGTFIGSLLPRCVMRMGIGLGSWPDAAWRYGIGVSGFWTLSCGEVVPRTKTITWDIWIDSRKLEDVG